MIATNCTSPCQVTSISTGWWLHRYQWSFAPITVTTAAFLSSFIVWSNLFDFFFLFSARIILFYPRFGNRCVWKRRFDLTSVAFHVFNVSLSSLTFSCFLHNITCMLPLIPPCDLRCKPISIPVHSTTPRNICPHVYLRLRINSSTHVSLSLFCSYARLYGSVTPEIFDSQQVSRPLALCRVSVNSQMACPVFDVGGR